MIIYLLINFILILLILFILEIYENTNIKPITPVIITNNPIYNRKKYQTILITEYIQDIHKINQNTIFAYTGHPYEYSTELYEKHHKNLFLMKGNKDMLATASKYGTVKNIRSEENVEYVFNLHYNKNISAKGNLCKIFNMYYTSYGYVPYTVEYEIEDGYVVVNYKNEVIEK